MSTLLIALAASVDGMLAGFALGMRRTRVSVGHLAVVFAITFACVAAVMACVQWLLPDALSSWGNWLGGLLLVLVGVISLLKKEKSGESTLRCTWMEAVIVGFSVAADASAASASLALGGENILTTALLMATTHLAFVYLGNILGHRGTQLHGVAVRVLPAAMLILLGLLRLPVMV